MGSRETRPRKGGWAPGEHLRTCDACGCEFLGEDRAFWCSDCAYGHSLVEQSAEQRLAALKAERDALRATALALLDANLEPRTVACVDAWAETMEDALHTTGAWTPKLAAAIAQEVRRVKGLA